MVSIFPDEEKGIYTAYIGDVQRIDDNRVRVVVEITGADAITYKNEYILDSGANNLEWLKAQIRAEFSKQDSLKEILSLQVGPLDVTETQPTQEELARLEYADRARRISRAKLAIDLGVIPSDSADFLDLQKWLIDNYKTEYLDCFTSRY